MSAMVIYREKDEERAGNGSFILPEIQHSIYRYIYAMRGGKEEIAVSNLIQEKS